MPYNYYTPYIIYLCNHSYVDLNLVLVNILVTKFPK